MTRTDGEHFASAVLAIDSGDTATLRALLAADPSVVHATGPSRDGDYFCGASLLQHVAWNPYPSYRAHGLDADQPDQMPRQMPDIVRALLEAGADPNFRNRSGNTTVQLLMTARLASEARLTEPLLAALLDAGASVEISTAAAHLALANHAPAAARALLARGVNVDLQIAAGLGDANTVRRLIEAGCSGARELGVAALQAYVSGHAPVLDLLLHEPLDIDATGVQNGTLLHRACGDGDLEMTVRLTELGADHNNRDNPFQATPLDWAAHADQEHVVAWILRHASRHLDIHQTVAHNQAARCADLLTLNSSAVAETRDIWGTPAIQPLRLAVACNIPAIARLLLEHGADWLHAGGDGQTAIDVARASGNPDLLQLMREFES